MKQIYNFDAKQPPILNESMLRTELAKRQLRRQTTLAAISGILTQLVILLAAFLLAEYSLFLSICCVVYVILSATGSTVVAILLHSNTGRRALRQS